MSKNKLISIRIPEKLLEEYKQFCDDNSMVLSKRIRKFMEQELAKWRKLKGS
jgi:antitoxin component of RelBE/YafQ-DinJ toxin-antitoxin module